MTRNFQVTTGEIDNAIFVLREVAQWCIDCNMNMWKLEDLTKDKLTKNLGGENFCIGRVDNEVAASMILQWYDPLFWPDIKENESGFIHKLCVRRKFSGMNIAKKMIEYSIDECRKRNIKYLRLDTDGNNNILCNLYENMRFSKVANKTIGATYYALYELEI